MEEAMCGRLISANAHAVRELIPAMAVSVTTKTGTTKTA
jgi:hypothetical protein